MKPVRAFLVLSFALLLMPPAYAEINVLVTQDYFNIGDTVEAEASLASDQNLLGFMRFTMACDRFSLPYYLSPVEFQAGFRSQVDAPPLKILAPMKGQCAIRVELLNEESQPIEGGLSTRFSVSDGLSIILLNENLSTLPGTTKKVEGLVRGAGDKTINADIDLWFDNESYRVATFNGKFLVLLGVGSSAKTGMHSLRMVATDERQNKGSFTGEVEVIAVPSRLEVTIQEPQQDPGKNISYSVIITDQAGDRISDSVEIGLKTPEGVYLFKGTSESGALESYILGQYIPPGEYVLESRYTNLASQAIFMVNTITDIRISQQGETVVVENAGNVPFKDEITLVVESEEKNHVVRKKIELKPGQTISIGLDKELPTGTYTVLLPQGMRLAQERNESVVGRTLLAQNVEVHDGRSPLKKAGAGISSLTGAVIGADGILTQNPWYAPILLFGTLILVGMYYSRGLWAPFMFRRRR